MNNGKISTAFNIYQNAFQMFPQDFDIVINMANILREVFWFTGLKTIKYFLFFFQLAEEKSGGRKILQNGSKPKTKRCYNTFQSWSNLSSKW